MTPDQLIAEGRKLERPGAFLRTEGSGPIAAIWNDDLYSVDSSNYHCWLTVDTCQIPGLPSSAKGFLSVYTDDTMESGRIELTSSWPTEAGIHLYAHPVSVLPPIDAVFLRGSDLIGEWLQENEWQREWGYNDNFRDNHATNAYQQIFKSEYPVYFEADIYAMLGGWHLPFPEEDWKELIDEHLMVMTIRDSEPWVEAWRKRSGDFKVIQRFT